MRSYDCVEDGSVAPDFVGLLGKHHGGGHALLEQPVPHLGARVRQRRRRVEVARAPARNTNTAQYNLHDADSLTY